MLRALGLLFVSLALAAPVVATQFGDCHLVGASQGATRVVTGDVDGDGDLDLVSSGTSGQVLLHRNADGLGGNWQGQLLAGLSYPVNAIDLGDLDGDGDLDVGVATAGSGSSGQVHWIENDAGDGSAWTAHFIVSIASNVKALAVGDLDSDDDLDLGIVLSNTKGWLANDLGDGSSWTLGFLPGPAPYSQSLVTLADLDGDDDLDFVYSAATPAQVICVENVAGDGSAWTDHAVTTMSYVVGIRAGDLDGDDDLDLLLASQTGSGMLVFVQNTGSLGTFWPATAIDSVVENPRGCALGDMDGDGDLDPVAISVDGLVQWNENGNGWLRHEVPPALRSQCYRVAAADLDADGDTDLAAVDYDDDRVMWWPQLTWFDEGGALAGALGEPRLVGSGKLLPGETVLLSLSDAYPLSSANLVLGFGELSAPFKGGTLVPNPDLIVPGIPTSFGIIGLPLAWPGGVPAGFALWYQLWIADPGGPAGFSATNAVRSVAP